MKSIQTYSWLSSSNKRESRTLTSGLEKPFCREGINMSLTSTHGSLSFVLLPQQFRWNLQSTEDVKSEAALTQSVRLWAARGV
ncbi:hypothetical protein T4E_4264 [Trichinella pseudospiralis]|uniref:Uncharacterized protein n=1 Tax=Trichinella pseudospiralis TaxID=6337 RepID=A0A0V0YP38_TRIPS|nr:hypothetical protein T4E_4264 [Trichinella pseudospiralis]